MNDKESIEVNFELGKYYYHEEHNLVKAKTHLEIAKKGLKKGNQDIQDIQDILDSIARLENQS